MAQTLETLSRRTETLSSIRSIVHTMKTMSAINAVPYEHAARSIESYHQTVLSGIRAFVAKTGPVSVPAVAQAERLLVVFGSDHGLCGNYNEALAESALSEALKMGGHARVLCVGARMSDALADQGIRPESTFLPPASADGIGRLASDIVTRLDEIGGGDVHNRIAVTLVFTRRAEKGQRESEVSQLLPLASTLLSEPAKSGWQSRSLPDYTMQPTPLLAALLRNHIFASVFRASAEAMVTENAARLALMQQAEQAVDDRLEEVGGQFRLVRQDEITNERMDIIIGFEALKKKPSCHSNST
ncbi:ATPase [Marinobacter sp. EhC06]|jgi:F-type H+-transporting ATPase subunit gamma|uniref:F0F1 ATP synthase subunit gamma n=1 Tax=Marinobacter TaxID=2742 RepID=UPI0007DA149D|nr:MULTISPECIES: FoF1 ATP synthase subunit gamma [unclassified Marinobacter]OAN88154.1 ATPase [Marinobacter sp. EhN04]OAN91137.1 ATPase [Marinobacter sp. EhC06]